VLPIPTPQLPCSTATAAASIESGTTYRKSPYISLQQKRSFGKRERRSNCQIAEGGAVNTKLFNAHSLSAGQYKVRIVTQFTSSSGKLLKTPHNATFDKALTVQ
jgi:hypothetical protein